jgi:hypothetical protein
MKKYTFDVLCDSDKIALEISQSEIIIALDHIETASSPAKTDIWFKSELSEGDETILNALVAAHDNTPLPENSVQQVAITSQPDLNIQSIPSFAAKTLVVGGVVKKLYARNTGIQQALDQGTNTITYVINYPWVKLLGVEVIGAETLDYCDFEVYDDAQGSYSGYPNLKLNQFAYSVNVPKDYYIRTSQFDADLYQGMMLKVTYNSVSAKTIGINLIMNEVKD